MPHAQMLPWHGLELPSENVEQLVERPSPVLR